MFTQSSLYLVTSYRNKSHGRNPSDRRSAAAVTHCNISSGCFLSWTVFSHCHETSLTPMRRMTTIFNYSVKVASVLCELQFVVGNGRNLSLHINQGRQTERRGRKKKTHSPSIMKTFFFNSLLKNTAFYIVMNIDSSISQQFIMQVSLWNELNFGHCLLFTAWTLDCFTHIQASLF